MTVGCFDVLSQLREFALRDRLYGLIEGVAVTLKETVPCFCVVAINRANAVAVGLS